MFRVPAADFSLRATLECGQAFRWRLVDGRWAGFIDDIPLTVSQDGETLCIDADPRLTAERVRRYFALDLPLDDILRSIDADAQIHAAIARHRGLRILRQDGWESLASFICSSFNNIVRIQGMIERLCAAYGPLSQRDAYGRSAFPGPEPIARASEGRLRELGLGFRAPYLRSTAQMIVEGKLSLPMLARTDYATVKSALLRCEGVGEKVADCVALFGFERYEAFPVDVWMARVMRYYAGSRRWPPVKMRLFAQRHFGRYAGWAQQYLFHDIRIQRKTPALPRAPLRRAPILAVG